MAKDPAFLLYTSDFYIGTVGMSSSQVGQYIRLLCLQHQRGGRVSKDLMLQTMDGTWEDKVAAKFLLDDHGYYNLRLEEESTKRKAYSESRRQNRMKTVSPTPTKDVSKTEPTPVKPKVVRHKYGKYENVLLNDEDHAKLKAEFKDWEARVDRLSEYMASKGVVYKNHLATIRAWAKKDSKAINNKNDADKDYGTGEEGWT